MLTNQHILYIMRLVIITNIFLTGVMYVEKSYISAGVLGLCSLGCLMLYRLTRKRMK